MNRYGKSYYWDELDEKFDLSTGSGFSRFDKALERWFWRKHKATLVDFDVVFHDKIPVESNVVLEVPVSMFGLHNNISPREFLEIAEGSDTDKFDKIGLSLIEDLVDIDRLLSDWNMSLDPDDHEKVIISYKFS